MKTIKISRTNFPTDSMFSWMNYFKWVLSKKYNVVVDAHDPDIVFYTNFHNEGGNFDYYTGGNNLRIDQYGDHVKKVFITGELFNESSYRSIINTPNYFALGFSDIDHPKYLKFPTYVLDTWVLYDESRIFDEPFSWLTRTKNVDEMFAQYKKFCSVVQASENPDRGRLFDVLEKYKPIKSSGPWRPTVAEHEKPIKYPYLRREYFGRIDGLTYRSKIEFFKECKFNIAFQYTNTPKLTQEKIIHAFAANTIPLFYGNNCITDDFNPDSFVNCHEFQTFEDVGEFVKSLDTNDAKCKKMLAQPYFHDNKLPVYYNSDRIIEFFDRIIN